MHFFAELKRRNVYRVAVAYAIVAYYLDYLRVDPELDSLRSDPRFANLLRRVRLAP